MFRDARMCWCWWSENCRSAQQNKTPHKRGFAGQRIKQRGIWGDRGMPSTRLLSVSRAAAGEGSMIDAHAPE